MNRAMRISVAVGLAAALTGVAATLTAEQSAQVVQVRDDCDPATFNADPPVGPGLGPICEGNGDTTFGEFIAELRATKVAEEWRFNPHRMSEPPPLVAHHHRGAAHPFTTVAPVVRGRTPHPP